MMSNTVKLEKVAALQALLEKQAKSAADQVLKHMDPVSGQKSLGVEMQKEEVNSVEGIAASDAASVPGEGSTTGVAPADAQAATETAAAADLKSTGSPVMTQDENGGAASKAASLKTRLESFGAHLKNKKATEEAAAAKKASEEAKPQTPVTAASILSKVATLKANPTNQQLIDDIDLDFKKLASTNPLFSVIREYLEMNKKAAEIEELAAAEDLSPEEAAQLLDDTVAQDPSLAMADSDALDGEALAELALAEEEANNLQGAMDAVAGDFNAEHGTDFTGEDVMDAAVEALDAAAAQGIAPEVLLQAVAENMAESGEGASQEDLALAEAIVEQAAEEGASEEDILQAIGTELGAAEGIDQVADEAEAAEEINEAVAEQAAEEGISPDEVMAAIQAEETV